MIESIDFLKILKEIKIPVEEAVHDYIDRQETIKKIKQIFFAKFRNSPVFTPEEADACAYFLDAVEESICKQEAADVRENVRGQWLKKDNMPREVECKCSVCGYVDYPLWHDNYWFKRNFCPHCGADMRGGE